MLKNEKGFVLVTSLVLLSILTLMGITSSYKTVMQIKISQMSQNMDRATAAANTGLTQLYWFWSADGSATTGGIKEFNDVIAFFTGGATVPAVYQGTLTPNSVAGAPSDATIQASTAIRVYTLSNTGITLDSNANWGKTTDPQMAVWVTAFDETTPPAYPYATPIDLTTGSCPNGCRMVTYSLGRSGSAKRMVRETHSVIQTKLAGVSAMTNAPAERDFAGICNKPATPSNGAGKSGKNSLMTTSDTPLYDNTLIEATQAPYVLKTAPSGTALQSNTQINKGSKNFRKDVSSTTGTNFEDIPYILYSGHDSYSAAKVDVASRAVSTTTNNLPANELPQRLVFAPPTMDVNTERVNFFTGADAQLFSIDTYRWGAEQLTCQDPTQPDGQYGNGIYCSKGENLRQALVAQGYKAYAPVTGRVTVAQLEYNIANSIPMFGLVRVMFPTVQDGNSATCNGKTVNLHIIESAGDTNTGSYDFNTFAAYGTYDGKMIDPSVNGGKYEFAPSATTKPDGDGDMAAKARWITYGMVLIDFFADYDTATGSTGTDTNTVFDAFAKGERLLVPIESPDAYLAVEHNFMVNPVMPRFVSGVTTGAGTDPGAFSSVDPYGFPTGAPLTRPLGSSSDLSAVSLMNMSDLMAGSGNKVNLASPYDGYFPWAEGLVPPVARGTAGTMRLMSRNSLSGGGGTTASVSTGDNAGALGLVNMALGQGTNTKITSLNGDVGTMMGWSKPTKTGMTAGGTEADVLKYYYDLMALTVDQGKAQSWPIAPWPGATLSSNFCIGAADCGTADPASATWLNNVGDKLHLMFPTGYMHGWKVALAALDINADEWNNILTAGVNPGIGDTEGLHNQLFKNCSQFGTVNGPGCPMGLPFNFVKDAGGTLAATKDIQADSSKYYNITKDAATGYGLLDADWQDIPSTMYSGGLLDMHAHSNITGIMYTPGPLEWEPGHGGYEVPGPDHMSYMNGALITGYGSYTNNKKGDDRFVLVFDMQSVDNINTNSTTVSLRRYDWQMLR